VEGWGKIPESARYAGMKPRAFREWLKGGLKHTRMPSGTVLVKFSDIDSFLEKYQVNENRVDKIVDETLKKFK
jgi:hypothetical protein